MRTNESLHGSNTTILAGRGFDGARSRGRGRRGNPPLAYTLIELLVATSLTLVLLGAVAYVFGMVGQTVNESRATLEMTDRLRSVTVRLQNDLEGITVSMTPPIDPGKNEGYFKYIEGPNPQYSLNPKVRAEPRAGMWPHAANSDLIAADGLPMPDTTVIDHNDILMFTTRSEDEPFVGRAFVRLPDTTTIRRYAESQVAEVAWFVRGGALYRRVLLVLPDFDADLTTAAREPALTHAQLATIEGHPAGTQYSFSQFYDLSVRRQNSGTPGAHSLLLNSLGDLTKPENRFAHQSLLVGGSNTDWHYPFHPHLVVVGPPGKRRLRSNAWRELGLPTLREMAHPLWGGQSTSVGYPANVAGPMPGFRTEVDGYDTIMQAQDAWKTTWYDLRATPHPFDQQYPQSGMLRAPLDVMTDPDGVTPPRTRAEEDIVLENVIGFDVKVWDPEAPVLQYTGPGGTVLLLYPGDRGYPSYGTPAGQQIWADLNGGSSSDFAIVSRGAYVDLNYINNGYAPFANIYRGPRPACLSMFSTAPYLEYSDNVANLNLIGNFGGGTYDTWSTHFEADGIDNDEDGLIDPATDGFDTTTPHGLANVVDDVGEQEAPPPYSTPLRGLKVTVRVYEPYSRKIREVTITQDFSKK